MSAKLILLNSRYIIPWESNITNLCNIIAHTLNDLPETVTDIQKTAFLIPHDNWINAGFSGCSLPRHILLDHTNENVGSAPLEKIEKLRLKADIWAISLPKVSHCRVMHEGEIVNLCGLRSNNSPTNSTEVTCPCCIAEIVQQDDHNPIH